MAFEPEEFVVEEITPEGEILEAGKKIEKADEEGVSQAHFFAKFVLQKRLWTTAEALKEIAGRLGISPKRLNAAGNKDRNAITTQLCTAFAVEPWKILALKIRDISINGAWKCGKKTGIGGLEGNRFTVILNENNCGKKTGAEEILSNAGKNNFAIPNFFGSQRFGSSRKNTATVGRLLLEGRHEEAVMNYLCAPGDANPDAAQARKHLAQTRDFKEGLREYPRHLRFERRMLAHLAGHPNDFLGAFRRLQRSTQLLFVHAVQSELFNRALEKRAEAGTLFVPTTGDWCCPTNALGFPEVNAAARISSENEIEAASKAIAERKAALVGKIIGYESELDESDRTLLEQDGLEAESFRIRSLPELSSKGTLRPLFVFLKGFSAMESEKGVVARFSMPSGSYATVALDTILGNNPH